MPKIILLMDNGNLQKEFHLVWERIWGRQSLKPYWASGIADGAIGYLNKEFSIQSKYVLNGY